MKTVFSSSKVKIETLGLLLLLPALLTFSAPRIASAGDAKKAAAPAVMKGGKGKAAAPAKAADMPGISISPSAYDFGNVNVGETRRATFAINSTGKSDLAISSMDIAPGERLFLGPMPKDAAFALLGSVCQKMGMSGCREAAEAFIRTLDYPSEFKIESGTCQGISPTIKGGTGCTIGVAYSPAAPGKRNARIVISSNSKTSPVLGIALTGAGVPPVAVAKPAEMAGISVSPSSFDFGNVNVGERRSVTLTLSSTGQSSLVISSIDIASDDPSEFEIDSGTCKGISPTIKEGTSCTISVAYSPSSTGKKSGKVEISSNAQTSPVFSVALMATGVPAAPAAKPAVPVVKPAVPQARAALPAPQPAVQQEKPITVTLMADKTGPALSSAAEKVTFTSHASGGPGTYEYKFWLKGPLTENLWQVAQEYSAAPTFSWTPTLAGSYVIWVNVRSTGNSAAVEGSAWIPFDVVDNPPVSSVTLTADKTSPVLRSQAGMITFTPHAKGGSGEYQYKFWLRGPSTGYTWTVVHEYGTAATFSWMPSQAGNYAIWVAARNTGSPATSEASGWMSFDVVDNPPAKTVALTPDKASPQAKTTAGKVTFTARAGGGSGSYGYEFWLKGPSTGDTWTIAQAYGKSNTFSWQPSEPGTYLVAVYARNEGSPAGHEAITGISFDILNN